MGTQGVQGTLWLDEEVSVPEKHQPPKAKKGREKKSKEFVPQVEMFIGNLLYEFLQTMEEDGTEGRS